MQAVQISRKWKVVGRVALVWMLILTAYSLCFTVASRTAKSAEGSPSKLEGYTVVWKGKIICRGPLLWEEAKSIECGNDPSAGRFEERER
jgi:hypothetical protein